MCIKNTCCWVTENSQASLLYNLFQPRINKFTPNTSSLGIANRIHLQNYISVRCKKDTKLISKLKVDG